MQRDKGANAERAAARFLACVHGMADASRRSTGEESQEAQGRDLKNTPGLCVQVKEMGAPSPLAALEEAIAAAAPREMPVAIVRQSRRGCSTPFRLVFTLDDALYLLEIERRFRECFPKRADEIRQQLHTDVSVLVADDASMKARRS
ncbi:MAG: hypothetical protein ABL977_08095 [Candidatus Eisenbacteria bacterium]